MRTYRWQDWLTLVLGIWLAVAPFWMAGYDSTQSAATTNSYLSGLLVTVFAIAALITHRSWEEWVEFALGMWLVVSPFVIGFYRTEYGASWNQIVVGLLIVLGALWALYSHPGERARAIER